MTDLAPGTEYLSLEDLLDLVNALTPAPSGILACSIQPVTARRPSLLARKSSALTGKAATLMRSLL